MFPPLSMHSSTNTSTRPILGPLPNSRPSQIKFIRPAQMSMFARLTCYPPLAQVTCAQRVQDALGSEDADAIRFTVVLESSSSFPEVPWEAQLWHNIASSEWSALPLLKSEGSAPLVTGQNEYNYYRHVFSEELRLPLHGGHGQFTVRYRPGPDAEWQWVNEQRGVGDGELVFAPRSSELSKFSELSISPDDHFGKYFDNLSPDVEIEPRKTEAPGSVLWHLAGNVGPIQNGQSGLAHVALGVPASVIRYFALVRIWAPWLGPRHGKDKFKLTEDAILCSFLRSDGVHVVLLAVSGTADVLTLFGSGDNGELVIKSQSDNAEASRFQVLASAADSFEVAMSAVVYEARKVARPYSEAEERVPTPTSPLGDDVVLVEKDPKAEWMAEWYDGLTYCTWNGLGQNLTEEKILHALDTLKSQGISIGSLIIDDNWQSLDNEGESQFKRRWQQFEANPSGFPKGLKQTVQSIRQRHPNIEHVAVWHALLGYWGGIAPEGDLAAKYKTKQVEIRDPMAGGPIAHAFEKGNLLAIDPDDVHRFYDDFFNFLNSVGVDSVKTDAQFFIDLLKDPEDRRRFMTAYQDAWSISSLRHFSTRAISCMSLFPQAIFHSQLPTNKPTIPLRNSDDFFPDIPESHPWHVFCNAHNALITRHLNVVPDWDMFQTSHPYASFHAAARCVSGGPIYITDEPGKHDIPLIEAMTAPTTHENTVILRPSLVGRTIDVYHDYNEGHVLRVGTYTGWARTGSGILGLFNVSGKSASTLVSLLDFPGIHEDYTSKYIVRAHSSGKITDPAQPTDQHAVVAVNLEQKGWEILTAYPTTTFKLKRHSDSEGSTVAVLGLVGKMTGAAAIVRSDVDVETNGRLKFDISLKALGTLGIYFSDLRKWSIEDDFMVTILGQPIPRETVWKEGGEDSQLLVIDVQSAWKKMGLNAGWSNDVVVQVFAG